MASNLTPVTFCEVNKDEKESQIPHVLLYLSTYGRNIKTRKLHRMKMIDDRLQNLIHKNIPLHLVQKND